MLKTTISMSSEALTKCNTIRGTCGGENTYMQGPKQGFTDLKLKLHKQLDNLDTE